MTRTGRSSERTAASRVAREDGQTQDQPGDNAPLQHSAGCCPGEVGVAGSERASDDRLARDRDRVEAECQEEPELERDLVRGHLGVTDPRSDRGGRREGQEQRPGAHDQVGANRARGAQLDEIGPGRRIRRAHVAANDGEIGECGRDLRDDRSPGRARDAEMHAVDEDELEDEIRGVCTQRDGERRAGVLQASEITRSRERDHHERRAEQRDAQIRARVRRHPSRRTHRRDDRPTERQPHGREDHSEAEREPYAGHAVLGGRLRISRADAARDGCRRAVRQEIEDPEGDTQDGSGDAETGQRQGPEMPDDRRVGQHVQRLGRERAERRNCEAQDLTVVRARRPLLSHPAYSIRLMDAAPPIRFAELVRRIGAAARAAGLVVPAFRTPPRRAGVARTIRRLPGGPVVAVRLRSRPPADVVTDMVEGVIVANGLTGDAAARLRTTLVEAVGEAGAVGPESAAA